MDKITFLNELELALDDLPREEKDSIMHKYENLFYEEELKGISESQIIKKLNDPYHISKEVKARSAIHYASYKPTLANIVRAILASLSLGILSLFIILIKVKHSMNSLIKYKKVKTIYYPFIISSTSHLMMHV